MYLRKLRQRFLLAASGIVLLLSTACGAQLGSSQDEAFEFPPTPTIPNIQIEKTPPAAAARSVASAIEGDVQTPQATVENAPASEKEIMVSPTATSTPSPTPTSTPTPTLTPTPTATPCATPGKIITGHFDSRLAGRVNYRVYVPPCYTNTGRTYPALYMLPGNIYSDSIWDELGLDEEAEKGIKENKLPPHVIVMVSGGSLSNNTSGGPASFESFMLEEFIPHIEDSYCIWPNGEGRAIGGMSRGGYWALEIAFRHAKEFASVGGHSAALLDYNGGPTINPLQTGLANDLDDLRVYLDIGENDWVIYNVRQLHEQMELADREHLWVLNEGQHEEAYWAGHVKDYLEWYTEPWQDMDEHFPPCGVVSADYSS